MPCPTPSGASGPAAAQREQPGLRAAKRFRRAAVRWARGTAAAASGFPRGPQGWREGATGLAAWMNLRVPRGALPRP